MMELQVICLGAVNVDLVYRVADLEAFRGDWPLLQPGGEAALAPGEESRLRELLRSHARPAGRHGGGQAANTAWALARMGVPVALVGRIGADADGDFLRASLAGVDLDYLERQGESGRAYILVDPEGERTIFVAPNTNDDLAESDIPRQSISDARFLHLTSFVGDGPLLVQTALARELKGEPLITLDPGELYARRGHEALTPLLARVDTLLVTEAELALLGGEPGGYPRWAPPYVIVKRGGHGARLLTRDGAADIPAKPTAAIVDTLGAGDVFAAGYLAGRLAGLTLTQAVRLANRAAAGKLAGAGREHYPDREFLQKSLKDLI